MAESPDEPLSPTSRRFAQPRNNNVIYCVVACEHPLDVDTIRTELQASDLVKHPRFGSLLITDSSGRQAWRKTQLNVDRHVIIHHSLSSSDISDEDAVNDYVADLCASSLPADKPLWELHLLMSHNALVYRLHHALGDGISMMSMLMSLCRRLDDPSRTPTFGVPPPPRAAVPTSRQLWMFLKIVWYTFVYLVQLTLRGLFVKDKTTAISGGAGVALSRRRIATARFCIEDMKLVKAAVSNATINDVLIAILSIGLSRYLEVKSSKDKGHALHEGLQITCLEIVNTRHEAGSEDLSKLMNGNSATRWGNVFGVLILPIYYQRPGSDPIHLLRIVKSTMANKKLPLKTSFSYKIPYFLTLLFGFKQYSNLGDRIFRHTTFTLSNLVGPREKISYAGNTVKHIRANISNMPHAIMLNAMSYAGMVEMQIQVAEEIIPDPKVLARCFEKALVELKEAI